MTRRTSLGAAECTVARTLEVIGGWWTPLILRDVFAGVNRFDALRADLGISRKVLAERLDALVEHGVLERVPYQDKPLRHEYRPTAKGAGLVPILLAMQAWGDQWLVDEPPVVLRHRTCGATTTAVPVCAECGEPLDPTEITLEPGPGLAALDRDQEQTVRARLAGGRVDR